MQQQQVNTIVQTQRPTSLSSNRSIPSLPQARILVEARVIINEFNNGKALLDSGASSCFITHTYCNNNNIEILQTSKDYIITGYNDESSSTHSIAMFKIELNSIVWHMSAIVLPILPTCDIILGMNFFESFDPMIDWKNKTVQLDPTRFSFASTSSDMIIASFHVTPPVASTHKIQVVPTPVTLVQPNHSQNTWCNSSESNSNPNRQNRNTATPKLNTDITQTNDANLLLHDAACKSSQSQSSTKISPTNSKYRMQGTNSKFNSRKFSPHSPHFPPIFPPFSHHLPPIFPPSSPHFPPSFPPFSPLSPHFPPILGHVNHTRRAHNMSTQHQHSLIDSSTPQYVVPTTRTTSNYNKITTPLHRHHQQKHHQDTTNQPKTSTTAKVNRCIANSTNHDSLIPTSTIDVNNNHIDTNIINIAQNNKITPNNNSTTNTIETKSKMKIKRIQPRQMKQLRKDPNNKIMCSIVKLSTSPASANEIQLNNINIFNENERNDQGTVPDQTKPTKYNEYEIKIHQEFKDIFQSIPGLPPSRAHDHRIELVEHTEPPSKPAYRLSNDVHLSDQQYKNNDVNIL
jgi:hypothetical protein